MTISYKGNIIQDSISKTLDLCVSTKTKIVIGNERILTNGFLRIYLKCDNSTMI